MLVVAVGVVMVEVAVAVIVVVGVVAMAGVVVAEALVVILVLVVVAMAGVVVEGALVAEALVVAVCRGLKYAASAGFQAGCGRGCWLKKEFIADCVKRVVVVTLGTLKANRCLWTLWVVGVSVFFAFCALLVVRRAACR